MALGSRQAAPQLVHLPVQKMDPGIPALSPGLGPGPDPGELNGSFQLRLNVKQVYRVPTQKLDFYNFQKIFCM